MVGKAELCPWEHHSPARMIQTSWMQATQRLRMSMSKSSRSPFRPPLRPSASAAARAELHLSWATAPRRAPRPPPRRGRAQPVSGTGCGASGAAYGMLPAAGAALSAWRGCAGAALRGAAASACGERAAGPGACARGCGSAECMSGRGGAGGRGPRAGDVCARVSVCVCVCVYLCLRGCGSESPRAAEGCPPLPAAGRGRGPGSGILCEAALRDTPECTRPREGKVYRGGSGLSEGGGVRGRAVRGQRASEPAAGWE